MLQTKNSLNFEIDLIFDFPFIFVTYIVTNFKIITLFQRIIIFY